MRWSAYSCSFFYENDDLLKSSFDCLLCLIPSRLCLGIGKTGGLSLFSVSVAIVTIERYRDVIAFKFESISVKGRKTRHCHCESPLNGHCCRKPLLPWILREIVEQREPALER